MRNAVIKNILQWTGERYLPWASGNAMRYEHLQRYYFASLFTKNRKVLDIGCGEGYGTYMLAKSAALVTGLDIDSNLIDHANNKYRAENLTFVNAPAAKPGIAAQDYDVIICFEMIEHIDDQTELIKQVKKLLKPDGLFIISSPNKVFHSDKADYKNPYHKKELYLDEFTHLLSISFKHTSFFAQKTVMGARIWPLNWPPDITQNAYIGKDNSIIEQKQNDASSAVFYIALASDVRIQYKNELYLFDMHCDLEHIEQQISRLTDKVNALESSTSWRITAPLRMLKNLLKIKTRHK